MKLTDLIPAPYRLWAWLAAAVAIAGVVWLVVYFLGAPQRTAVARRDAAVAQGQARTSTANAVDAVDTLGANQAREASTDQTTGENDAKIRSAEGADVPVGPAVASAGRCAVCLRDSAIRGADCQRLLRAGSCGVDARRRAERAAPGG